MNSFPGRFAARYRRVPSADAFQKHPFWTVALPTAGRTRQRKNINKALANLDPIHGSRVIELCPGWPAENGGREWLTWGELRPLEWGHSEGWKSAGGRALSDHTGFPRELPPDRPTLNNDD